MGRASDFSWRKTRYKKIEKRRSKLEKSDILDSIHKTGIIAVIRGMEPERVVKIAESLINGGIKVLEVTMNSPKVLSVIEKVKDALFDSSVIIGAGTVLDSESARAAILAGAEFIVGPNLNFGVIKVCNRYDIPVIPGVMTPTEIVEGLEAGADLLKIFPANVLGPSYIKSILPPIKYAKLVPTGGISLSNVGDYISAGAFAVGAGGGLLDKILIEKEDYATLSQRAKTFRETIDKARGE